MAGNLRSPRKRALEIGTEPGGFGDSPYHPQGGHPISPETPAQTYQEQPPAVGGTGEPINQPKPVGG